MNELLAKISSYNIFNYLVPGALFVIAAKRVAIINLDDPDLVTKLVIFYIVGLILSRVGSLLIEPAMRSLKFVRYAPYKDYALAGSKDVKIEVLVEVSNTYRTLSAAFLCLLIGLLVTAGARNWETRQPWVVTATALLLTIMFLLSFAKQASYVRQRVEAHTPIPENAAA